MRKKLLITLLATAVCLLGVSSALAQEAWDSLQKYEEATGNKIESFSESPMLEALVAAGKIPPLEERIPKEPQVIEPLEKIGRYGGTMYLTGVGVSVEIDSFLREIAITTYDSSRVIPCIVKGWDISDGCKTLTLYLRKGMKWSDGETFTADDILFWYEDIILNDELYPVIPVKWSPGGEPMKARRVDDYTIQFKFSVPYPTIESILVSMRFFSPKHYLKKYHIDYNPDANKIAKEEGYGGWGACFQFHHGTDSGGVPNDVDIPVLTPWVVKERDAGQNSYWERNPYYWRVDTAGNQLPYIDKVMYANVETPQVVAMKCMSGEITANILGLTFSDYPIYKKNEEKGGYKVYLVPDMSSSVSLAYVFNYTHKDPVLKKIFNDLRFRQATSLAINREEICQTVFYGKIVPWTAPVTSSWTGFEDWMGTYYAQYDPERANKLLDEMGLKWDENHEYRLRSDGKTLSIVAEYCLQWLGTRPGIEMELIKEYWKKVGIKATFKQMTESLNIGRMMANEHDLTLWGTGGGAELQARAAYPIRLMPPWHWAFIPSGGPEWRKWYDTEGKEGEEPPENIKLMFNVVDEWLATPRAEEEKYRNLANELLILNVKGLYQIGTCQAPPRLAIRKNGLRNARRETATWDFRGSTGPYMQDQWFFEQ